MGEKDAMSQDSYFLTSVPQNYYKRRGPMTIYQETPFQKALEAVESLPIDAREEIIEILKRRLAEDRREEIAANAREALKAVREKRAKYGTIEDLKKDLLGE